jgi:hypothetical protein
MAPVEVMTAKQPAPLICAHRKFPPNPVAASSPTNVPDVLREPSAAAPFLIYKAGYVVVAEPPVSSVPLRSRGETDAAPLTLIVCAAVQVSAFASEPAPNVLAESVTAALPL